MQARKTFLEAIALELKRKRPVITRVLCGPSGEGVGVDEVGASTFGMAVWTALGSS